MRYYLFAWALSALSMLSGCRTGRPDYSINVPPNILAVRPARSVLFVEVPLRLDALNQALEQAVGRGLPAGGGGGMRLGVMEARWRLVRGPAAIVAMPPGLGVHMAVTGEVSLGAGILRCQAGGIGGAFTIALRPTLAADGALVLREPHITVAQQGSISCAGVQVPVGDLFSQMLRPIEQALAAGLAELRLPLGPVVSRGLAELAVPRAIDLDGQKACLDLDPGALVVTPLAGSGPAPMVRIGVDVAPRLSLGDCPTRTAAPPRELVVREEAASGPSHVQVAVAVPTAALQAPLGAELLHKRFGSGSSAVQVDSLTVGDTNGRMLIRLGTSGAYQGDLFLWGTPAVREEGGRYILSVPDLQVANESTSRLQDLRLNLFQLFDGNLADKLRPQLVLDVTDRLRKVQQKLSGNIEISRTPLAALRSELSAVRPLAVQARPGLLIAYLELSGKLTLDAR